jgi:hypothetical protein
MVSVMLLMVLKMMYCLKKVNVQTATLVMVNLIPVLIVGKSMTSRDLTLQCHLVE